MKVNNFTKKILNREIGTKCKILEFKKEREIQYPFDNYYHLTILHRGSILYNSVSVEENKKEVSKETFIRVIENSIKSFDSMIKESDEKILRAKVFTTIRVRFFEDKFKLENEEVSYLEYEKKLRELHDNLIEKKRKGLKSIKEVYDKIIEVMIEDRVSKIKEENVSL